MVRPSPSLQAWLRQAIEERRAPGSVSDWPRRLMADHDVLLIEGDSATLWFLGVDGRLYSVDADTVSHRLELETNEDVRRSVLERAAATFPLLLELLDEPRPSASHSPLGAPLGRK